MMRYLAGVLTVIAAGVLLVAYGLLSPRAEASVSPEQLSFIQGNAASAPATAAYSPMQVQAPRPVAVAQPVRAVQTIEVEDPPARQVVRRTVTERAPRRDWRKTALVIGGSSATGAGIGAIFGGKKGALIGAAIGGGASTIFETTRR